MVTREGCKLRMQLKKYKPPKQRAVASVNRELSVLRHMFSKAFEWGMIERSPEQKGFSIKRTTREKDIYPMRKKRGCSINAMVY